MSDLRRQSVYVKNYRTEDFRIRKKYMGNLTAPNLTSSQSNPRSQGPSPSPKSSSGYCSSGDLGSSNSDLSSSVSLAGNGHLQHYRNNNSSIFSSGSFVSSGDILKKFSLVSFGLTFAATKSSSFADIQSANPTGCGYNWYPPSVIGTGPTGQLAYQRTLSGGAKVRCNSADPIMSRHAVMALEYLTHRSANLLTRGRRDSSVESRRLQRAISYGSPSPSYGNSRSASADRFGGGPPNAYASSGGRIHLNGSTSGCGFTPVTELARNVSSYNWDKGGGEGSLRALEYSPSGRDFPFGGPGPSFSRQSSGCLTDTETIVEDSPASPVVTSGTTGAGTVICAVEERLQGFVSLESGLSKWTKEQKWDAKKCKNKAFEQRTRAAKGHLFISTLTPEDEQTLARAEARLAVRRQARAEARDIRMKELEKQQKESDDNADRHYDMYTTTSGAAPTTTDVVNRAAFRVALGTHRSSGHSGGSASYHSSRRSSEDSSEDGVVNLRDLRHEVKELEDKFRKAMIQNAQLDNEKSALTYQVELLKDKIEDLEESQSLLQREHRDKCRDFENLKRISNQIKDDLEFYKSQLLERDELIKEYGLVLVENEVEVDLGNGEKETRIKRALVTQQTAQVLSTLGDGSLDVRLKKVLEEKNELLDEIRRLKLDLEEERSRNLKGGLGGGLTNNISSNSNHLTNGPESEGDISKQIADYRFKTQKYEQEIATLQANVARLDTQVQRFKTAAEEAESREDDLKVERRKLQREFREALSKLDELETTNSHLTKRLDKLKTAKSTLLKEL